MGIHEHAYNNGLSDNWGESNDNPMGTERARVIKLSELLMSSPVLDLHLIPTGETFPTKCCVCEEPIVVGQSGFVDDAAERRKYSEARRGVLATGQQAWFRACKGRL